MAKYIDASAVITEINKLYSDVYDGQDRISVKIKEVLKHLQLFISSLPESKSIDLEKEIERVLEDLSFRSSINSGGFTTTVLDYPKIAKHFYELGKQAKKEE